jgi:hypothetical protein
VTRTEVTAPGADDDPEDGYMTVEQEMIHHAPHSGHAFRNDRRTVWDIMSKKFGQHECWIYILPEQKAKGGRRAYTLLFDNYLGPQHAGNMMSNADTKLASTLYNGEHKRFSWETYVRINTEQHTFLNGLKEYG